MQVKQLHPLFVGEVSGIELAKPLSAEAIAEIQQAIHRYAVLVFHDQHLDDEAQLAFARHFGPIEPPQAYSGRRRLRPVSPMCRTSTPTAGRGSGATAAG
jgi:alpha-ketoglutarate-dependent taurine dioxygenase